jgi:7tm Odorant receptor
VIIVFTGLDGILYGCCLYIAGQFKIVEQKIKNLMDWREDDSKPFTFEENKKIKTKLTDIVEHHNQCIELTKKVSQIYEFIIFTSFISASIAMGLCSLNIIIVKGMGKFIFVCYLIAIVIELYGVCINGSALRDASASVAVAIYNFDWYKGDRQVKYMVLTMLMRSQREVELQIPFCTVSMETFAAVSR